MKNQITKNHRMKTTLPRRPWLCSLLVAGLLPASACLAAPEDSKLAAHPSRLKFPELVFTPPQAAGARSVLSNGTPVYVV